MKINLVKFTVITFVTGIFFSMTTTLAAKVEVKLIEPKKFHDAEVTGKSRGQSIEDVEAALTSLFQAASKGVIKDSENLIVEVTDLDLAGYMERAWKNTGKDIRIVKDNDRYRLEFRYQLTDSDGKVLKEGEQKIKEFLRNVPVRKAHNSPQLVSYMQDDVEEWLEKSFK